MTDAPAAPAVPTDHAGPTTYDGDAMLARGHPPWNWGGTPEEVSAAFPCDGWTRAPAVTLLRAVDVAAPPALTFRWLCQLRAAPYSYDWLDNRGRRSPRRLTPGLDRLDLGQSILIARLVSYRPGQHLTGLATPAAGRLFGVLAVTYQVLPRPDGGSRLLVRLTVENRPGAARAARRTLLAWGDLVMMRKQLRTLGALAERDAAAA